MFVRLLPILLSCWLLVGLGSGGVLGAHVHEHEHGAGPTHLHVAAAFDSDHAKAHADGAVDHEDDKTASRVQPSFDLGPAVSTIDFKTRWDVAPIPIELPQELLARGPPPHARPPSQAPPLLFAFA